MVQPVPLNPIYGVTWIFIHSFPVALKLFSVLYHSLPLSFAVPRTKDLHVSSKGQITFIEAKICANHNPYSIAVATGARRGDVRDNIARGKETVVCKTRRAHKNPFYIFSCVAMREPARKKES